MNEMFFRLARGFRKLVILLLDKEEGNDYHKGIFFKSYFGTVLGTVT